MRFFHIAFMCFLFGASMYCINQIGIFGYANTGNIDNNITTTQNTVKNLIPDGNNCGLTNLFCLSWYLINGFNTILELTTSALIFPLQLAAWYNLPLWLAWTLQTILSFIEVAGFAEIISGRNVGA